ncbi:MAG: sigma-70 family RNA polymerase sigma factor [Pirellulaceae bacterium]|nr:sigma-70 family RNA polymerase sigma factor [Pirellulaceae bacterium]
MTIDSPRSEEYVRLWAVHAQRIYSYILSMLANRADADDVFQEVSMTIWNKFEQFESGTNFRAWAYRVSLNKVREFQRARRNEPVFCDNALLEVVDRLTTQRSDVLDTQYRLLTHCLHKLCPRDRDLIERLYRVGATPKSVSQQVGRSVAGIYKALGRIHDALLDCVRSSAVKEECP